MDIRRIRHFLALVEHGSFRRAAEAVPLSQSALSRSIQTLEDELGAALFDRSGQRISLTPFARSLLPRCRRLLFEANELRRDLTRLRSGELGRIDLGCSPTPASVCLRSCLGAMARAYPRLPIGVSIGRTPEILDGLRDERFDLAVVDATAVDDPHGLEIEELPPLAGGFLCRRGHPLLRRKAVGIDDLRRFPIACSPVSRPFVERMLEAFGPAGHPERLITILCDNYEIQRDLALAGDVVLMSVHAIVRDDLARRRLIPVQTAPSLAIAGRYAIVRLSGRSGSPALERLCDEARCQFRE